MNYHATLHKGYRHLHQSDFGEAIRRADELITARPDDPKAYFLKALALHEQGTSTEALTILNESEALDRGHFPLFLEAIIQYDTGKWERAARAIGGARQFSHQDNYIAAGMERLILIRENPADRERLLKRFSGCPSIYNSFVGPRLLCVLEEEIAGRSASLDLQKTSWGMNDSEPRPLRKQSLYTDLCFYCFRLPVLFFKRLLRRHPLPLAAEKAYLRGDLEEARRVLQNEQPKTGTKREKAVREAIAFLSLELRDFRTCSTMIDDADTAEDPDAAFMKGFSLFHLGRYKQALKILTAAEGHPETFYFRGLCNLRLEQPSPARKEFTRYLRQSDLACADRIYRAGETLGLGFTLDR